MQFKLVVGTNRRIFEEEVNSLLDLGWQLKGQHQTIYKSNTSDIIYTQAMVKED